MTAKYSILFSVTIALNANLAIAGPRNDRIEFGSAQYQRCLDASPVGSHVLGCHEQELDRQEKLMRSAYDAKMRSRAGSAKAGFRASQQAWMARRQKTCRAESKEMEGGTGEARLWASCLAYETAKRVQWLTSQGQR